MSIGHISRGITFLHIYSSDSRKFISGCSPIAANIIGAINATTILHKSEYIATAVTSPPSIRVTTGAAVAVGINTQIKTPLATMESIGSSKKYVIAESPSCVMRSTQ